MKTMKKLRSKNSLVYHIAELIERGEKLTYSQLAERFDVDKNTIGSALVYLRKAGYLFFSIGAIHDPKGKGNKEGIVVDVREKEKFYKEARKGQRKQLDARIETTFGMIEAALYSFP